MALFLPPLSFVSDISAAVGDYDSVVVVSENVAKDTFPGKDQVEKLFEIDSQILTGVTIHYVSSVPGSKLIISPTGPTNRDFDDVRVFAAAARTGVARALKAGSRSPLFYFPANSSAFENSLQVSILGAYQEVFQELQARELYPERKHTIKIGFSAPFVSNEQATEIVKILSAMEAGRSLGRDLGGSDPDRMTPVKFTEYLTGVLSNYSNVSVKVDSDPVHIAKEYPLLYSVARATIGHPTEEPRVIRLEVNGEGPITDTLYLVGKGVCFDTGGLDIKTGGIMAGMSRDKCGASYVAGFVLTAAILKTPGLKVVAMLGLVKNAVSPLAYHPDEIIRGHSGCLVKVINTDAEGRFVMADLLSHLRVEASTAVKPQFLTMATLTGAAGRSFGPYTVLVENGPAKKVGQAQSVHNVGEQWGDPFELGSYRREDVRNISPGNPTFDVLQLSDTPSRGCQYAASFLMIASGISKHGNDSDKPYPYVHYDIAPSASEGDSKYGKPTGCCVVSLAARYLLK